MYKFTRNTKIICISLIMIGLFSIGYGFFSTPKYSDSEIHDKVLKLSYELNSNKTKYSKKDVHHDNAHHGVEYKFSDLSNFSSCKE